MLAPASAIDARGTSGLVEFALWSDGLTGNAGWTFQLDAGSGYVTRLSELSGANHDWQIYRYALLPGELVSNLKLRWQFRGGQDAFRIDLDQITVKTVNGGGGSLTNVIMFDDGLHHDGEASDGIYGIQLPTFSAGTTIGYYVTALDNQGTITTDPSGAPASFLTFIPLALDSTPILYTCVMKTAGLELGWSSVPDRDYAVLYKARLNESTWTLFATQHSTSTATTFTDTNAVRLGQSQGYYQVTLQP